MIAASLNKFLFRVSNFDSLVNYLIDMTFLFIYFGKDNCLLGIQLLDNWNFINDAISYQSNFSLSVDRFVTKHRLRKPSC